MVEPKSRQDLKRLVFKKAEKSQDLVPVKSGPVEYSTWRKITIVFVVSWMALTLTFSSTATFSATMEIANSYGTTRGTIDVANAAVFVLMGATSFLWAPISQVSSCSLFSNKSTIN